MTSKERAQKYVKPAIKRTILAVNMFKSRKNRSKYYIDEEALLEAHWSGSSWST